MFTQSVPSSFTPRLRLSVLFPIFVSISLYEGLRPSLRAVQSLYTLEQSGRKATMYGCGVWQERLFWLYFLCESRAPPLRNGNGGDPLGGFSTSFCPWHKLRPSWNHQSELFAHLSFPCATTRCFLSVGSMERLHETAYRSIDPLIRSAPWRNRRTSSRSSSASSIN